MAMSIEADKQKAVKKDMGVIPKSRNPTELYEGDEFLVVRAVHVDRLPNDLKGVTESRVSSIVEVEQSVIDSK